jgi:hypothetical protein
MKVTGEAWGVLLLSIILVVLRPWWVIGLIPFVPPLLLMLVCGLFRWKRGRTAPSTECVLRQRSLSSIESLKPAP